MLDLSDQVRFFELNAKRTSLQSGTRSADAIEHAPERSKEVESESPSIEQDLLRIGAIESRNTFIRTPVRHPVRQDADFNHVVYRALSAG